MIDNPTVLVVEDDTFISRSYKAGFEKEGFNVLVAYDGDEALEILEDTTPDVILLDLIMPKKNGFEVLEQMRHSNKNEEVPVVVSSNLSQEHDVEQAKQLGAVDYICKDESTLKETVEKVQSYLH